MIEDDGGADVLSGHHLGCLPQRVGRSHAQNDLAPSIFYLHNSDSLADPTGAVVRIEAGA